MASLSLQELKVFADTVGIGYTGLDQEQLFQKLTREGVPA